MIVIQGGSENPMPPLERQKLMNLKGTDQEKIKKYIFKTWPELYEYHEHPDNPDKWGDCFLQRKLKTFRFNSHITELVLAVTIYRWRLNAQIAKKFDGGKSAHVLLRGRPSKSEDVADKFGLKF